MTFNERCRKWIIAKYGDQTHVCKNKIAQDGAYQYDTKYITPFSDCFDIDESKLELWDIYMDHDEGFHYSSYTWQDDSYNIMAKFPLTCNDLYFGPQTMTVASNEDASVMFGQIIRELCSD